MQREEEEGTGMIEGIKRFRQAIKNQQDLGSGDFRLTYRDAEEIADEIEDELARLSWAEGVSVPKDADGMVVPLDTEKLYTDKGEMVRVESICYGGRLWHVRRMHSDKTYWLDSLHLAPQDSWERLKEDLNLGCRDYCERYRLEECDYNMRTHMFYRAKALAERDAKEAGRG